MTDPTYTVDDLARIAKIASDTMKELKLTQIVLGPISLVMSELTYEPPAQLVTDTPLSPNARTDTEVDDFNAFDEMMRGQFPT